MGRMATPDGEWVVEVRGYYGAPDVYAVMRRGDDGTWWTLGEVRSVAGLVEIGVPLAELVETKAKFPLAGNAYAA